MITKYPKFPHDFLQALNRGCIYKGVLEFFSAKRIVYFRFLPETGNKKILKILLILSKSC